MSETGKTKVIAITGGIGSGKSTVGEMVAAKGYPVIDSDKIAREITGPGSPAVREIAEAFGSEVLTADGALDREKVAEIVFSDPAKRKILEGILHPEIGKERRRRARETGAEWVFEVIPLLFEAQLENTVDRIWLCYAPSGVRLGRSMDRDDAREERILARMSAQIPDEDKIDRVDVVIDTAIPLAETRNQVERALALLEENEIG